MKGVSACQIWIVRVLAILFWTILLIFGALLVRADFFAKKRSITMLAWSGTIDREVLKKFERETGIKVFFNTYSSNEELLVKLRATGGIGYDLVVPSDYAVMKLVNAKLIKKIDKSRCIFWENLDPILLGHYFDPLNEYSIPFGWDIYCIGINKHRVDKKRVVNGWDLLFPRGCAASLGHRLVMTNDSLEALLFAYFGCLMRGTTVREFEISNLSHDRRVDLYRMLLKKLQEQRVCVEAYATVRADYFLGMGYVDAAVMQTTDLVRAMRSFDNIDFILPDPTFVTVENCVIPCASEKDDLVYVFLNFLYRHDVMLAQFAFCPTAPARLDVFEELANDPRYAELMRIARSHFASNLFIRDPFPEYVRYDLWVAVKS